MQAISCPYTHHSSPYLVKRSKHFFLKVVIVRIKLKGMEHRARCKHVFCHYTHPRPLGFGQNVKIFYLLKVVMLHIKIRGMEKRASCKPIFCPLTHPQGQDWVKRSNIFFLLKVVMLHIKIKDWNTEHHVSTYSALTHTHTHLVPGWSQNVKAFFWK